MKYSAIVAALLGLILLINVPCGFAMETDQYNLPPEPLFDIGDEVSDHIAENLFLAVAEINAEIGSHQACLADGPHKNLRCGSPPSERSRLAYLQSNDAVAHEVFKQLGDGSLVLTVTGKWFMKHRFSHEPARYKTSFTDSIYMAEPIDYLTMSPTVRIYGTEFGTDKIEHMLQQGYDYYNIYKRETSGGATPEDAAKKAVDWGKMTEWTYFGMLIAGVYSNADLVANYAGMKFYQGMTQPVQIGTTTRPAILSLTDGSWTVNRPQNLRDDLLKPFISDHLNEALNPSVYAFTLYPFVRNTVKKRSCPQWKKMYPDLTKVSLENRSGELTRWNGDDYGHLKKDLMVPLAETCFE